MELGTRHKYVERESEEEREYVQGDASFESETRGFADAGVSVARITDTGITDAGIADAGIADAGIADARVADAGFASREW